MATPSVQNTKNQYTPKEKDWKLHLKLIVHAMIVATGFFFALSEGVMTSKRTRQNQKRGPLGSCNKVASDYPKCSEDLSSIFLLGLSLGRLKSLDSRIAEFGP